MEEDPEVKVADLGDGNPNPGPTRRWKPFIGLITNDGSEKKIVSLERQLKWYGHVRRNCKIRVPTKTTLFVPLRICTYPKTLEFGQSRICWREDRIEK